MTGVWLLNQPIERVVDEVTTVSLEFLMLVTPIPVRLTTTEVVAAWALEKPRTRASRLLATVARPPFNLV